jgi:sporulation protein YlmC with PRC-barrel domain
MYAKSFAIATSAVLLAGLTHAQYDNQQKPRHDDKTKSSSEWNKQSSHDKSSARIHRLGRFIDRDVQTRNGEDIGDIENFALDLKQGKVALVILDVDDDIADGLVPVPYDAFEFKQASSGNQPIALKVDKAQLRNAPSFRENNWPNLNDPQYVQRIETHYNVRTSSTGDTSIEVERDFEQPRPHDRDEWNDSDDPDTNYPGTTGNPRGGAAGDPDEAQQDARRTDRWSNDDDDFDRNDRPNQQQTQVRTSKQSIVRANHLIGADVDDRQNENLGEIEDVLIELQGGRIVYAVLSSGGVMGMGDTLHPVPVQALQVKGSANNPQLVLDMDANRLEQAPTFEGNEIPTTFNPQLSQDLVAFYDVSEPDFVYGFADDQSMDRGMDQRTDRASGQSTGGGNVKSMINNWPQASQKAAQEMLQKYGQPDVVSNSMLVWEDAGQFEKCTVYKDEVEHQFPTRHSDVLEQCVSYRIPADMLDELAQFDGSLIAYRTGGILSARCHMEAMNILALNLAHEVITKKRTPDEARQFLARTAQEFMQGQSSEYTDGLMFQTSSGNSADPDRPAAQSGAEQIDRSNNNRR